MADDADVGLAVAEEYLDQFALLEGLSEDATTVGFVDRGPPVLRGDGIDLAVDDGWYGERDDDGEDEDGGVFEGVIVRQTLPR